MDAVRRLIRDYDPAFAEPLESINTSRALLLRWAERPPRLAIVIAVILSMVAIGDAIDTDFFHNAIDFRVYFMGGQHFLDPHLYTLQANQASHLPFTYPPIAALLIWPLTCINYLTGLSLWSVLSFGALGLIIYTVIGLAARNLSTRAKLNLTLLMFGPCYFLEPIQQNFNYGQINLLLGAMILYDFAKRGERRIPRGLLIGLATAIKLIPGIFILFLLVRRQFRSALVATGTFFGGNLLMLALNPVATRSYWSDYVSNPDHMGGVMYNSNQSLFGVIQRLAHQAVSNLTLTTVVAVTLLIGVTLSAFVGSRKSELAALITVGFTGDLVSPISWSHHLYWFVPLLIWLALGQDSPRLRGLSMVVVATACWASVIWLPPKDGSQPFHWTGLEQIAGNAYALFMVAFLLTIAFQTFRRNGDSSEVPLSA